MTVPAFMAGVQLTGHGGPEMLVWNPRIALRPPGAGEVLVQVLAAGVNNTDINTRIGWYSKDVTGATDTVSGDAGIAAGGWAGTLEFPRIQGADLCGKVVAVGPQVTGIAPGMRVTCATNQPDPTPEQPTRFRSIGSEYNGAFAQYCLVPAQHLFDVTASALTDVEIAAIPCAHGTAMNLLSRAGVGAQDRVLITGASGGVGLAAVELARIRGAHVTGVTAAAKSDAVRAAGADSVMERGATPPKQAFSVVIDVVGGPGWPGLIDALRPGGRYATSGAIAGPMVTADLRTLYLNDLTIFGCTFTPRAVFAELVGLINAGRIRPLVSRTYPLTGIAQAQTDFAAKIHPGKLVLIPPP